MDIDIDTLPVRLRELTEAAYLEFSAVFGPRLRRYFITLGSCPADAEALTVSCLTDIALKADRFDDRGPGMFERWVFRLARNAWIDDRRRTGGALASEVAEPVEVECDTALTVAVEAALAELDELDRAVVIARHFEDVPTFDEIGSRLGLDGNTARVRHHRALRKLSKKLAAFAPRGLGAILAPYDEVFDDGPRTRS